MTALEIQAKDQAGATKLTAVSLWSKGKCVVRFYMLKHNAQGQAILPDTLLKEMLALTRARRGDTFTV